MLQSCSDRTSIENSEACIYSERFHVYFNPVDYTVAEVESFATRKEKLLTRLDSIFGVTYDTIIPTFLNYDYVNNVGTAAYYMRYNNTVHESREYITDDSGHEIVHAVTIRMLGRARSKAMIEGVATLYEVRLDEVTALEQWFRYQSNGFRMNYNFHDLFGNGYDFDEFSLNEYYQAAAFLEYIDNLYGTETVIALWQENRKVGGEAFLNTFETVCNTSFDQLETDFENHIRSIGTVDYGH